MRNYDLARLIVATRGGSTLQSWRLDGAGNWSTFSSSGTTQPRTTDASNEITSISGSASPTYDNDGNMTFDGTYSYAYDAWGRLVNATNGSNILAEYQYDGLGRRIEETSFSGGGTSVVHDYYSGQQVVETRQTAWAGATPTGATVQYQYVWSPRYVDAPILRDTYSGGALQSGSRLYYCGDSN